MVFDGPTKLNRASLTFSDCQNPAEHPDGGLESTCAGTLTLLDESWTNLFVPYCPPIHSILHEKTLLLGAGVQISNDLILKDPQKFVIDDVVVAILPIEDKIFPTVMRLVEFCITYRIVNLHDGFML
jgi:hypothetical protein